jgi:hypothetical protein
MVLDDLADAIADLFVSVWLARKEKVDGEGNLR